MGTVGLSFGSPTSGTGFNVSSTVAQIVGNLQKVETPWQNQLSSLESQDTVISNLGSLFSKVSNDIGQLTDFEGVLAQKAGSSSDTNVLDLTSASSSAVAGTHTIVVNNLAATSSGYLAPIANASDTLSGSITVQAGSGAAQTINVSSLSNQTLAGVAAAINASGAGVDASVLTDSGGSRLSLVSATSGAEGDIAVTNNSLTAAAANTLAYTGTAGSGTSYSTGTLSPVSTVNDALSGSISIQVGSNAAQVIDVPASPGNNLTGLENAINGAAIGVTASIVTNSDGTSSLSLTSGTEGAAGTLTVNSSVVDANTALSYDSAVTGQDASLTVDGVNLASSSNTVTNLIPGVTFQLLSASPIVSGTPEPVQVVIANDNSGVENTVNQFVTDYNSLISAMNTQEGNTSSGTPEPLFGSPTLSLLQQQLLGGINAQNPNGYLTAISKASDSLSGSISIAVGAGSPQVIDVPTGTDDTLAGLAGAINSAGIGVTASVVSTSGGYQLELLSSLAGSSGALTVSSSVTDTTTSTALNYTSGGSDLSNLTSLGISVNNDGSLTFDASTLDGVLNSDYSSVEDFFQASGSWGLSFSAMLSNAGSSSATGVLALASSSNSSTESAINAKISSENLVISAEQSSITAELNQANEILEELPSQLSGINELYSAITGYNQGTSSGG